MTFKFDLDSITVKQSDSYLSKRSRNSNVIVAQTDTHPTNCSTWTIKVVDDDLEARVLSFIMVALCNRADYYIFVLWLLLSFFLSFFPRLISAAADWMSTILPHMVWP